MQTATIRLELSKNRINCPHIGVAWTHNRCLPNGDRGSTHTSGIHPHTSIRPPALNIYMPMTDTSALPIPQLLSSGLGSMFDTGMQAQLGRDKSGLLSFESGLLSAPSLNIPVRFLDRSLWLNALLSAAANIAFQVLCALLMPACCTCGFTQWILSVNLTRTSEYASSRK